MKREVFKILIFLTICLISLNLASAQDMQEHIRECATAAGEDATYLKDFVVSLEAAREGERPPVYRQSLALRKNVLYRFSVCNMEDSDGEAVLRVYDQANLILSTWYPDTGKEYNAINFQCKKSGVYTIVISFKDGKKGEAIGILSYVSK